MSAQQLSDYEEKEVSLLLEPVIGATETSIMGPARQEADAYLLVSPSPFQSRNLSLPTVHLPYKQFSY